MNDHIGPVQVNMGGIQVDADDMLKKLVKSRDREKERERGNIVSNRGVSGEIEVGEGLNAAGGKGPDDMKAQNEALNSFFAGLMKRGPSGSPRGMPSGEKRSASRDTPSKKMTPKE